MRSKKCFMNCLLIMTVMIFCCASLSAQLRIEGATDVVEGTTATYRLVNLPSNYTSISWNINGSSFGGDEYLRITWNYPGQGYINVVVYTSEKTYYADLTVNIRRKNFSSKEKEQKDYNDENRLDTKVLKINRDE